MNEAVQADAELRQNGLGSLAVLHDHLISYITFLLDLEDVVRLSCCSRILRVFACEEPLWLGLCLKLQEGVVEYKANWRQTALATYTAKPVPAEAVAAAARPLPPLQGLSSVFLYRRWYRCHVDLSGFVPPPGAATVERVNAGGMSPAEFMERYDKPGLPVLMDGLMDSWPVSAWSLPALSDAFPAALFKVSKPHGGRALMTMRAYVDYMTRQADEEPLYVFDPNFAEAAPGIRQLYDVPRVFTQDMYSELGGARPNYRWLVLGPARAGASWHVDPALTSAWNALLSGRKRWALYPPHMPPPGVGMDDDGEESHTSDDGLTSLQWFLEVYPTLPPERRPVEFVQNPGDVVFVPGGWWHCVLNLETSVAVTQNYVGLANLSRVVRYMADGSSAYHRAPLELYDPETEVTAWAAQYPHLVPEGAGRGSGSDDGDQGVEVGCAPDNGTEAGDEEEEEEGESGAARQRKRRGGGPRWSSKTRQRRPEVAGQAPLSVWGQRGQSHPARGVYSRCLLSDRGDKDKGVRGEGCGSGGGGAAAATNGHADGPSEVVANRSDVSAAAAGVMDDGGEVVAEVTWRGELQYEEVAVWRRERILGRWLRKLWERQPDARPVIQGCLFRHLHAAFWRDVLGAIVSQQPSLFGNAAATGGGGKGGALRPVAEPTAVELMPMMGADATVFLYDGMAIKIFVHEMPAMRGLMCALEACASQLLLPCNDGIEEARPPILLPKTLAWGAVAVTLTSRDQDEDDDGSASVSEVPSATESPLGVVAAAQQTDGMKCDPRVGDTVEAAVRAACVQHIGTPMVAVEKQQQLLLYVLQEELQGSHVLQELLDQGLGPRHVATAAEALGDLLGAMHSASAAAAVAPSPPPADPLGVEDWVGIVRHRAVWHDRYQSIWVSELGCLSSPSEANDAHDSLGGQVGPSGGPGGTTAAATAVAVVVDAIAATAAAPPAAAAAGAAAATVAAAAPETPGGGAAAAADGWLCEVPVGNRWWPFVQHLRRRTRHVLDSLPGSELPMWVKEQLPAYLPADPALLLGFTPGPADGGGGGRPAASASATGGPGVGPLLLHGDVTAHNVIVSHPPPPPPRWRRQGTATAPSGGRADGDQLMAEATSGGAAAAATTAAATAAAATARGGNDDDDNNDGEWRPRVRLVDFSDAGHGDPLYELLPLLGSCLRCDTDAAERFWARYRRHVDVRCVWPRRRRSLPGDDSDSDRESCLKLSYCAMCYCLLHEEAELLLQRVWQALGPDGLVVAAAAGEARPGAAGKAGDGGLVRPDDGAMVEVSGRAGTGGGGKATPDTLEGLAARLWGFLDGVM